MEGTTNNLLSASTEDSLTSGSRVILLRHGNSEYNFEFEELEKNSPTEEDYRKIRINKDLRDPPLSQLGLKQWEKARRIANTLKVEVIVVSPLLRAIETAYEVFKEHPNFENIKFILLPKLREALDTTSDIPINILDTIEEYKGKFKNFDWTRIYKYPDIPHYFLTDIPGEVSRSVMANKTPDTKDPLGSNAFELLLEAIDQNYPNKSESIINMVNRGHKAKKSIHKILNTMMTEEDSKLVVVGHSNYFKYWTSKWDKPIEEYEILPEPKDFKWLENWEFYADSINFPVSNN